MKYRLRFFHTDPSVVSVVGDYDTLEAAKMGAGIGYGIIEWRELAPNRWVGESGKLPFWYTIDQTTAEETADDEQNLPGWLQKLGEKFKHFAGDDWRS